MKRVIAVLCLVLLFLALKFSLQTHVDPRFNERVQERELYYLPKKHTVVFLSFGFRNLLADYLFMKSTFYFVKHFKGNRNFRYLQHLFAIVVALDPLFEKAYRFGAITMLSAYDDPQYALRFLRKGFAHIPGSWKIAKDIGLVYYSAKDYVEARKWFMQASNIPGAPKSRMLMLYSSLTESIGQLRQALILWTDAFRHAEDQVTRSLAAQRLFVLHDYQNIHAIQTGLRAYKDLHGTYPESLAEMQKQATVSFALFNPIYPKQRYVYDPLHGTILVDYLYLQQMNEYGLTLRFDQIYPFMLYPDGNELQRNLDRYLQGNP